MSALSKKGGAMHKQFLEKSKKLELQDQLVKDLQLKEVELQAQIEALLSRT